MRRQYRKYAVWGASFAVLITLGAAAAAFTAGAAPYGGWPYAGGWPYGGAGGGAEPWPYGSGAVRSAPGLAPVSSPDEGVDHGLGGSCGRSSLT